MSDKSNKPAEKEWDVFISHASEDKDEFVRPLAQTLSQLGVKVWFDEFSLELGDSLSRSIDEGLAKSNFGIVVISHSFIQKQWPPRELRGLVQRELLQGQKIILPIWFGVSHEEVLNFSPTLADAYAIRALPMEAKQIALTLLKIVRPDIYANHNHADLESMLAGKALKALQREVEHRQFQLFLRISSMVAYDLNNCIEGLSLMAMNMERHFDSPEFRSDAIEALTATTRKIRLLASRLSVPELADQTTVLWELKPADLVQTVSGVLPPWIERARPLHEVEIKSPEPVIVNMEIDRFRPVVNNLIQNALDAMSAKSGKLTIEVGKKNGEGFFSVKDTGVGMSEEFVQTRLFRPFMTMKRSGTGLGLYVIEQLVKALGGRIVVVSKLGFGTTVTVIFPLVIPHKHSSETE